MRYPIGIQSFPELRSLGCVYVDKTEIIHKLLNTFNYVFLGRPRRFGKSLLMSTIQAYFEGRKELFEGLAIERLTTEWTQYPVLHFDLNVGRYETNGENELQDILDFQLSRYERIYGGVNSSSLTVRFLNLIMAAKEKTGQNVVVLIDEYDKPILSTMGTKNENDIRVALKSFYGCIKSSGDYIRFAMFTGVSKFGKLSVFSDLNNIKDISLHPDYASICGITKKEITQYFSESVAEFAESKGVTQDEMLEMLRQKYDGYRFTKRDIKVFNPYSLLNALADQDLNDYWFESGTPTFLVKLLLQKDYDLRDIECREIDTGELYKTDNISLIPILYQSGYLTIKEFYEDDDLCVLGYPNMEVEAGFLRFLLPYYSSVASIDTKSELNRLKKEIKAGDVDGFMTRLQSIFCSIPYSTDNSAKVQEDQFRNLMFLVFKLIGMNIHVECPMSKGRTDAVIFTADHIYVMEFKIDSTPEKALEQIHEKGYAEPYRTDGRQLVLIGINYSTTDRGITGWVIEFPRR